MGDPTCKMFNELGDNFQTKLLMLLDDVQQFFLWALEIALDGRKIDFDWLKPGWDNDYEWPNVTYNQPTLSSFEAEIEQNIAEVAIFNLALCMSFPH